MKTIHNYNFETLEHQVIYCTSGIAVRPHLRIPGRRVLEIGDRSYYVENKVRQHDHFTVREVVKGIYVGKAYHVDKFVPKDVLSLLKTLKQRK